jgi:hypothetical protein
MMGLLVVLTYIPVIVSLAWGLPGLVLALVLQAIMLALSAPWPQRGGHRTLCPPRSRTSTFPFSARRRSTQWPALRARVSTDRMLVRYRRISGSATLSPCRRRCQTRS